MSAAATTVVVVPREAHSPTVETLQTLFATEAPIRLVVVDGGSPRRIRRQLQALAAEYDFTLIRRDAPVTGNEARNQAMAHVDTEFVVFLDNDTLVPPGWLGPLERCARETGAWLVSPVVLWGPLDALEIHFAGGTSRIVDDATGRRFEEHNTLMHRPAGEAAGLTRSPSEFMEFHSLLVRVAELRQLGALDEGLVAGRDHSDLTLRFADAGGSAWLEPAVVVRYPWPKRLSLSDYPFYLTRWSDQWGEATYERFNARWGLTDTAIDDVFRRGHLVRRLGGSIRARTKVQRFVRRARRAVDLVVTPLAVRACERQRARAAPPYVVHAASWDSARLTRGSRDGRS